MSILPAATEASISMTQIEQRRWELIRRALMHLEKKVGHSLTMHHVSFKEEDELLKITYKE